MDFFKHNQPEEKQPEAPKDSPKEAVSAFDCPDCEGAGLKDQYNVCPRCSGTGQAGEQKTDFAEGSLVITNGLQYRVVNGQLEQI